MENKLKANKINAIEREFLEYLSLCILNAYRY
jgi:hypothetical protein